MILHKNTNIKQLFQNVSKNLEVLNTSFLFVLETEYFYVAQAGLEL
jgi:hypothetical protein